MITAEMEAMSHKERIALLDKDAARIRQKNAEAEAEPEAEDEESETAEPIERFLAMREYLDGALRRATQSVLLRSTPGANPLDVETLARAEMSDETGMAFCSAPFFGDKPRSVMELANNYIEIESNTRKTDRLIDALKDKIEDLREELFLAKGRR